MWERIEKAVSSKWFALLSLLVILAIMLGAYFLQQQMETYLAWGLLGLLVGCFLANATVLLPAPGLLLVCQFSLAYGPLLAAMVGSIGTSLGEMVGFFAGFSGKELLPSKPGKIAAALKKHPYRLVFIFSLIPLPVFDVVGLVSGALQIDWKRFYIACLLGKFIKMLGIGFAFCYLISQYPDILNGLSWEQLRASLFG